MAAIASQQALAAKTSVAGAKLNLKNKAARKTVKAFSARAQAVATKAVRHAADPPPPLLPGTKRAAPAPVAHLLARAIARPRRSRSALAPPPATPATRSRRARSRRADGDLPREG